MVFRLLVGFCKIVEFVINLLVFYFQTLNEFSLPLGTRVTLGFQFSFLVVRGVPSNETVHC